MICVITNFVVEFLSSQFLPGSKAVGVLPKVKQGLDCRQSHAAKLMKAVSICSLN